MHAEARVEFKGKIHLAAAWVNDLSDTSLVRNGTCDRDGRTATAVGAQPMLEPPPQARCAIHAGLSFSNRGP